MGDRRYTLVERLARGGMGEVHLAVAHGLGGARKLVVVKQVLESLADDPEFHAMFLNEARLAASLDHPHIVRVYDVCEIDGRPSMVMEYVHGESLGRLLQLAAQSGGGLSLVDALTIVDAVAAGLACAHEARDVFGEPLHIVHRDVAPNNILVGYEGEVKLIDFGIARAMSATRVTRGTMLKGKVAYMAPEQFDGGKVDPRTDIFALGIVLYEATTLRRAFRASNDAATLNRIVNGDIVAPADAVPGYPARLQEVVMTALATDPGRRFPTAADFRAALADVASELGLSRSLPAVGETTVALAGRRPPPHVDLTTIAVARARRLGGPRGLALAFGAGMIATGAIAGVLLPSGSASGPSDEAARAPASVTAAPRVVSEPSEGHEASDPSALASRTAEPEPEPDDAIPAEAPNAPVQPPSVSPSEAAPASEPAAAEPARKRRRRAPKRSSTDRDASGAARSVPRGLHGVLPTSD